MSARALLLAAAVAVLAGWAPVPAWAQSLRVDDSASQVLDSSVRMKWDSVAPRAGERPTVTGHVGVLARLDTAPWAGRNGRIYLVLPPPPSGEVVVGWTSRGRLLPGNIRAGERALVYAGPLPAGLLEDTLALTVQADGGRLARAEQLHFAFELDLEAP